MLFSMSSSHLFFQHQGDHPIRGDSHLSSPRTRKKIFSFNFKRYSLTGQVLNLLYRDHQFEFTNLKTTESLYDR